VHVTRGDGTTHGIRQRVEHLDGGDGARVAAGKVMWPQQLLPPTRSTQTAPSCAGKETN
jgi:hypothetical protein